jgi:uncharacterized protein (DUF1778 family)
MYALDVSTRKKSLRAEGRGSSRISLRIRADEKALLLRAAAISCVGLTDLVVGHISRAAREVIDKAERLTLSERDSLRVLDLLANPPAPNARLKAAARSLPPLWSVALRAD